MGIVNSERYSAYWPEDGETADDASPVSHYDWQGCFSVSDAADHACEMDHSERDGWERMRHGSCDPFPIVIIDHKENKEVRFNCYHEPSVDHYAEIVY